MPKVVDAARITSPQGTVWRVCACCGRLAAMPPNAIDCAACAVVDLANAVSRRRAELLYAVEQRDGARAVAVLELLRQETSPIIADGVLRGLITSGRLTLAGGEPR